MMEMEVEVSGSRSGTTEMMMMMEQQQQQKGQSETHPLVEKASIIGNIGFQVQVQKIEIEDHSQEMELQHQSHEFQSPKESGDSSLSPPPPGVTGTGRPNTNSSSSSVGCTGLSKKALKRLAKQEKWESLKNTRRQRVRQKNKERKERKKEQGAVDGTVWVSRKALKKKKMKDSACKVRIVIDMSFDELMTDKDLCKCVKQIHRCYSVNRRLPNATQLHLTSFNGLSASKMEKFDGFNNWDVDFHSEQYDQIFPKDSLIYLTGDSNNVIHNLQEDKVYVIGALVDHNSKKGLCHRLAMEKNIQHARLPIDEFMEMKTRKVLSINHVFEIIGHVCQGISWKESFLTVIPQRKNAVPKNMYLENFPECQGSLVDPGRESCGSSVPNPSLSPNPVQMDDDK